MKLTLILCCSVHLGVLETQHSQSKTKLTFFKSLSPNLCFFCVSLASCRAAGIQLSRPENWRTWYSHPTSQSTKYPTIQLISSSPQSLFCFLSPTLIKNHGSCLPTGTQPSAWLESKLYTKCTHLFKLQDTSTLQRTECARNASIYGSRKVNQAVRIKGVVTDIA